MPIFSESWNQSAYDRRLEAAVDDRGAEADVISPFVKRIEELRRDIGAACRALTWHDTQCGLADADALLDEALGTLRATIKDLNDGQADELLNALAPEDAQ